MVNGRLARKKVESCRMSTFDSSKHVHVRWGKKFVSKKKDNQKCQAMGHSTVSVFGWFIFDLKLATELCFVSQVQANICDWQIVTTTALLFAYRRYWISTVTSTSLDSRSPWL
ncbi:hypothetical protein KIN20_038231 [Parelaphostrongylus tenuis]|uniref:Uncharacterized protein n=1 Tax=Parelaphostrongylus tenuis TaxID=148309 RepID=A0AAD5WMT4_PARTN|nr:hypothetical protein KIN20_038231 [Parelaphostrongylus tenuis]